MYKIGGTIALVDLGTYLTVEFMVFIVFMKLK